MTQARMFRSDAEADDEVTLMVTVLDFQDAAPSIRRLQGWALDLAQPQPGETVVDVGSGTGTMTRRLGALVAPDGQAVGVEPNPRLREVAASRAATSSGVRFVDGLAADLPFADGSVDVLWCERVLQHVADPQAAIDEFARVLRPGGRAVVLDTDHATRVTSAMEVDVEAKLLAAFMSNVANPRSARHIPQQAMQAGFTIDPDIGSSALIFPSRVLLDSPLIDGAADTAVATGSLGREEAEEAVRGLRTAAEAGHAFSAVTVFGFLLRKPAA
jgi:ubiquinone/menaquinone biosynthesis C-methylase UbiE